MFLMFDHVSNSSVGKYYNIWDLKQLYIFKNCFYCKKRVFLQIVKWIICSLFHTVAIGETSSTLFAVRAKAVAICFDFAKVDGDTFSIFNVTPSRI